MSAWIFELKSQTRFERNTRGRYVTHQSIVELCRATNIKPVLDLICTQAEQEAAMYQFEIDELKTALEKELHEKQQLKNVLDEFEMSLADIAGIMMRIFHLFIFLRVRAMHVGMITYICLYGSH